MGQVQIPIRKKRISASRDNLLFLSEISAILSSSLDYTKTLSNVARAVVPEIADWVIIDIVESKKIVHRVAVFHRDSRFQSLAKKLQKKYPPDLSLNEGVPKVYKSGKSVLSPVVSDNVLRQSAQSDEHYELMKKLGFSSGICLALKSRGKVVGVMTLIYGISGRSYSKADFALAEEIANRVALAIENSRLYTATQKAVQLRNDFISIASHELKTPLTSLKMYTQLTERLVQKNEEKTVRIYLHRINDQVDKLTYLISAMLDITKLEQGKLDLQKEVFSLGPMLKEVIENVQAVSPTHTIYLEGVTNVRILADKNRIGQVLTNLITNAIKYSPYTGTVRVQVLEKKSTVTICVEDFGVGIDKVHQKRIFKKFYRVHANIATTSSGLGIGLFISYDIIKRHKGKMWVESEKGKGSKFFFSLPRLP